MKARQKARMVKLKTNLADAAKAIQAGKSKQPQAVKPKNKPQRARPTDERHTHNQITSAGLASRITPPIETMLARDQITAQEFATLKDYTLAVATARGSETRSCCDNSVKGNSGEGPSPSVINARLKVALWENRAGPHVSLVRAVCQKDTTLTQWCIDKYGGRERIRNGKVEIRPVGKNRVRDALKELRTAARLMRG